MLVGVTTSFDCCCLLHLALAGMRVIGVLTTLSKQQMAEHAPDQMFADISAMSVEDLCAS